MKDALLLIDVINRFDHDDGEQLLRSFRERLRGFVEAIRRARAAGVPVVYVNDHAGKWDSDARELVRSAREDGLGGDVVAALAPEEGDPFVIKARYSVFDHTLLEILLREWEIERLLMCGGATEMCIVQSAIDARELGYKVTIIADACATVDEEMERLSLEYADRVVRARIVRAAELVPGEPEPA